MEQAAIQLCDLADAGLISADRSRRNGEQRASPLGAFCLNVSRSAETEPFNVDPTTKILRFTLTFNDLIRWNAGVFNLWLDASCNLQRLKFDGLPAEFDIEVQYETPLFQKSPGAEIEQQFYRLRDAADETHTTFLDRWFPDSSQGPPGQGITNGAVTWVPGAVMRVRLSQSDSRFTYASSPS